MEPRAALHIRMLSSISDPLKQILTENWHQATQMLPFKETYAFYQRLKPWHASFLKPPMPQLRQCQLETLASYYAQQFNFGLFDKFPDEAQRIIRDEIAHHMARAAMDTFMGGRLRNLSQIGIKRPEWPQYQVLVREYYQAVISLQRQAQIQATQQILARLPGEIAQLAYQQCEGELFYDVDRLRLMSHTRLETYLKELVQEAQTPSLSTEAENLPGPVRESLSWMELPSQIGLETLKQRYRELALLHHPDKGGRRQDMQRLNRAYRVVSDYIQHARTE